MSLTERLALLVEMNPSAAVAGLTKIGTTAEKELSKAEGHGAAFGKTMSHVGVGMIGVGAVIGGVLFEAAEAAGKAELATIKLENSVKNSSKVTKGATEEFLGLAKAIQSKTAASRIDIIAGEAVLVQFGATNKQVLGLTPLVVDLSRKMGLDLPMANKLVGKALEGSTGALKKAGIIVDETVYKTDRYRAVTEALRRTVGGFADTEGKTFEGQIQRLKNEFTDLEAGVGKGAVEAFTKFLGPVDKVSQAFTNLSPGVQSTIGEVAAFGAAGLLAVGTTATLAGKILSAKKNFSDFSTEMPKLSGALRGVAVAAGVVGAAFALLEAVKFAQSLGATTVNVDKFSTALLSSDTATRKQAAAALVLIGRHGDLSDVIRKAADQNVVGANRMIDTAAAAGVSADKIDKLRKITADKATADKQGAKDQQTYSDATQAGADATDALSTSTAKAVTGTDNAGEAYVKLAGIVKKNVDPVKELSTAIDGLVSSEFGMISATDGFQSGLNALPKDIAAATAAGLNLKDTFSSTSDAAITLRGSLISMVDKGAKEIDALVASGANVDEVTQRVAILSAQFEDVAKKAGLPQPVIDFLLESLHKIPGLIPIKITADTSQANAALDVVVAKMKYLRLGTPVNAPSILTGAGAGPGHARGGPIDGPTVVGEEGPEVFQPRTPGNIISNAAIRRAFGSGNIDHEALADAIASRMAAAMAQHQGTININTTARPQQSELDAALVELNWHRNLQTVLSVR